MAALQTISKVFYFNQLYVIFIEN